MLEHHAAPMLSVVRQVTNWGFAIAVKLTADEHRPWNVVDAYGEMSSLDYPPYSDIEVRTWAAVYRPDQWSPVEGFAPEDLDCGSVKRCGENLIAVKLEQPAGHPCWLVFTTDRSVDLVDHDHVRGWDTAYAAQDSDEWALLHGLNPNPSTREEIV